IGGDVIIPASLAQAAHTSALIGDVEAARRDANESLRLVLSTGWALGTPWVLSALGQLELALGNFSDVDAVLAPLTTAMMAMGVAEPTALWWFADHVEALVALSRLDEVEEMVRQFGDRSRTLQRRWGIALAERCRGLLLGARGETAAAVTALERAVVLSGELE